VEDEKNTETYTNYNKNLKKKINFKKKEKNLEREFMNE
jgi:hypothetical protein